MLNRSEQALKEWKGFDEAIDRWLEERHELIVFLTDFASHRPFRETDTGLLDKIDRFTSLLIDYVSAGHFEFYQRLMDEGREFGDHTSVIRAKGLLEYIEASTRTALRFDNRHGKQPALETFADDLNHLAEALEERFEAEDWMIGTLHTAHTGQRSG